MENQEYVIPGPPDGQLRFKTEQEFKQEFGEQWRMGYWWCSLKDYLFGLPVKEEWVDHYQVMHPDKCPHGDPEWACHPISVTRHPLPEIGRGFVRNRNRISTETPKKALYFEAGEVAYAISTRFYYMKLAFNVEASGRGIFDWVCLNNGDLAEIDINKELTPVKGEITINLT